MEGFTAFGVHGSHGIWNLNIVSQMFHLYYSGKGIKDLTGLEYANKFERISIWR